LIDVDAIGEGLRAWVVSATGLEDSRVIYANQSGPNTLAPYATLELVSSGKPFLTDYLGHDFEEDAEAGQEVVQFVTGPRDLLFHLNLMSRVANGSESALSMATALVTQAQLPSFIESMEALGVAVQLDDPRGLPRLLATNYQGRALIEVTVSATSYAEERTGYIATAGGTGTVTGSSSDPSTIPFNASLEE
jgi:hypothetical protein